MSCLTRTRLLVVAVAIVAAIAVLSTFAGCGAVDRASGAKSRGVMLYNHGERVDGIYRVTFFDTAGKAHTFKVVDGYVGSGHRRTTSADTYGALIAGQCYQVDTIGFRSGVNSAFPNLTSAVLADCPAALAGLQQKIGATR